MNTMPLFIPLRILQDTTISSVRSSATPFSFAAMTYHPSAASKPA